jgi:hypothetical protein
MRPFLSRFSGPTGRLMAIGLLAFCASSAQAGSSAELALPGACAEPRDAVYGSSQSSGSVVGALASFVTPADVAAAPAMPARPGPGGGPTVRPGPCDNPGAGCSSTPAVGTTPPPPDSKIPIVGGGRRKPKS